MKREDLRSRIIPTTIGNTDEFQNMGNKKFNTTDLIYLDSYDEQYDGEKTDIERRISATDYAQMNSAYICDNYTTRTGRQTTWAWCRSACIIRYVCGVAGDGGENTGVTYERNHGLCPSLHYHLPSDISVRSALRFLKGQKNRDESEELEQFDIREVKDTNRKNYISYLTNWRICKNKSRGRFK